MWFLPSVSTSFPLDPLTRRPSQKIRPPEQTDNHADEQLTYSQQLCSLHFQPLKWGSTNLLCWQQHTRLPRPGVSLQQFVQAEGDVDRDCTIPPHTALQDTHPGQIWRKADGAVTCRIVYPVSAASLRLWAVGLSLQGQLAQRGGEGMFQNQLGLISLLREIPRAESSDLQETRQKISASFWYYKHCIV